MKIILLTLLTFSLNAWSAEPTSEITFLGKEMVSFQLFASEKKESAKLVKKIGKKTKTALLKTRDFNSFSGEVISLMWNNKYRAPSSGSRKCSKHAEVQVGKETSVICAENIQNSVTATSLLNRLDALIRR